MHELGIALQVVEAADRRAGAGRIRRVSLEVGVLTAVLPDALSFCFDLASRDTRAQGATLEVKTPPARVRCRGCEHELSLMKPIGHCACGGVDFEWITGTELRIVELEVEEPCVEPVGVGR